MCRQPFAHLLGLEGLALLRGWAGDEDFGESFVREGWERRARCSTILSWRHTRECLIEREATETAYAQWARAYDIEDNGLFDLDVPSITDLVTELPKGRAIDAACGTGRLAIQLAALGFQTGSTARRRCWSEPVNAPTAPSLPASRAARPRRRC
jgi:hypothetical protein